ncbi:hypothetical protein DM02DRAFT_625395 [Periconia macrospinosa]|uniref:Fungal N-terminal domain-containing protein n=1 Tax=Periconia macrospinosa TaxID=97972 RepID=A0A2V1E030_9PLEO|nr:hypothetical protein DM02DRAFT_625395 [Periconia macrospinosa]
MADPLTIIGSAGAICNIVDVLGKTISNLNDLRSRWENSDIILLGLTSQLVSLRAALEKIQVWNASDEPHAHHQLVMDLDVSISCCKLLLTKLDDFVTSLNQPASKPLDMTGKAKVVFGISRLDEIQKLLERQTNALVLLLTACNCETLSQQKQLLERPKSRKTLKRAKTDTVSLIVHRDTSSYMTKWTGSLSKISRVFDFDNIVFSTRVYECIIRQSMKDTLRERRGPKAPTNTTSVLIYGHDLECQARLIDQALGPYASSR